MPETLQHARAARRGRGTLVASLALSLGAGTVVGAGAVTAPAEAHAAPATYTVKAGDTWWSISRRHGMDMHELASLNGTTIDAIIYVGDVLKVSEPAGTPSSSEPIALERTADTLPAGTYTVQAGDSWWRIADKHGMDMYALAALNDKTINSPLHVGDTVIVSGTAAAPAPSPAPAPAPAPSPAPVTDRQVVIDHMLSKIATPNTFYQWGGSGPYGYDCSGLTREAFAQAGKNIARTSHDQYLGATKVSRAEAQPGDLFFWRSPSTGRVYHVAVYLGEGKIAHALNASDGLKISQVAHMQTNLMAVAGRY